MAAIVGLLDSAGLPITDIASIHGLRLWVVETEDSIAGVIALEGYGAEALLRSLAVAPTYRKCGLGAQLVAQLEQDAQAEGVKRLVLLTQTAEPFFRALGYDAIDRSSVSESVKQSAEFRSLCPASATCMAKTLG
jgi:amino-acid N-acetyltransferase